MRVVLVAALLMAGCAGPPTFGDSTPSPTRATYGDAPLLPAPATAFARPEPVAEPRSFTRPPLSTPPGPWQNQAGSLEGALAPWPDARLAGVLMREAAGNHSLTGPDGMPYRLHWSFVYLLDTGNLLRVEAWAFGEEPSLWTAEPDSTMHLIEPLDEQTEDILHADPALAWMFAGLREKPTDGVAVYALSVRDGAAVWQVATEGVDIVPVANATFKATGAGDATAPHSSNATAQPTGPSTTNRTSTGGNPTRTQGNATGNTTRTQGNASGNATQGNSTGNTTRANSTGNAGARSGANSTRAGANATRDEAGNGTRSNATSDRADRVSNGTAGQGAIDVETDEGRVAQGWTWNRTSSWTWDMSVGRPGPPPLRSLSFHQALARFNDSEVIPRYASLVEAAAADARHGGAWTFVLNHYRAPTVWLPFDEACADGRAPAWAFVHAWDGQEALSIVTQHGVIGFASRSSADKGAIGIPVNVTGSEEAAPRLHKGIVECDGEYSLVRAFGRPMWQYERCADDGPCPVTRVLAEKPAPSPSPTAVPSKGPSSPTPTPSPTPTGAGSSSPRKP